jgi:cobalt-zinc-cadmium efflux system membrane fusion protein
VVVPRDALQRLDDGWVVFVRVEAGLYEPRAVDRGASIGDRVEVNGPIEAGEPVVTTGAFLLKTELRRDAIGAGCCEIEHEEG